MGHGFSPRAYRRDFQSTGISLSVKRETVCTVHFFYMKCSFEAVRDLNTEINRFGFVLCYYEILGIELVAQRLKQLGCLFSLYNKMKKTLLVPLQVSKLYESQYQPKA